PASLMHRLIRKPVSGFTKRPMAEIRGHILPRIRMFRLAQGLIAQRYWGPAASALLLRTVDRPSMAGLSPQSLSTETIRTLCMSAPLARCAELAPSSAAASGLLLLGCAP